MTKKPTDRKLEQKLKEVKREETRHRRIEQPLSSSGKVKRAAINGTGKQQTKTFSTVSVPKQFESVFHQAEHYVAQYFAEKIENPEQGTIDISGERYILVRAASISTEFHNLIMSLYHDRGTKEARKIASGLLFDLGHALGKSDAKAFHAKVKVTDPIDKLSIGPIHFAYSGWAFVKILPESNLTPDKNYFLIYDHPYSFEADTWMRQGKKTGFPVCTMNAGYSSGWCEESFGLPLVAIEIACRSKGDDFCRFIMAPPTKIQEHLKRYLVKPHPASIRYEPFPIPEFFERKRIEEILRESEERFRSLVQTVGSILVFMAPDYKILEFNHEAEHLFGYQRHEVLGRNYLDLFIHDKTLRKTIEMDIKKVLSGEPTVGFENLVVARDGTEHVLLWNAIRLLDSKGQAIGIIASGQDISKRKQAEEALQRKQQTQSVLNKMLSISMEPYSLEEMLDCILDHIISVPRLTLESKAAIFLVEDQSDMLVMKSSRKLPKELQKLCAQVPFGQCLCGKAAQTKEIQFTRHISDCHEKKYKGISPHGQYCVPILSSGKLLGVLNIYIKEGHRRNKEEEDFLLAITHVLAGIVDRKRAEIDLQLFRNLVNQSNDAVFVIDPQTGHFLDLNDKACSSLGYGFKELLSLGVKDIEAVIPNNFSWQKHVREVRKKGNMVLEGLHKRKDCTTFPVEVSVKWITQEEKSYLVAVARDITERKRAEAEVSQYREHLENLVEKRTAELKEKHQKLLREIEERKRAQEIVRKSEAQFKKAQQIACLGHWELDLVHDELTWSDELYRIFGVQPQEFGASYEAFLEMVHPEDRALVDDAYNQSLKTKKPYNIVHRLLLKDGTVKYVNEQCVTEYDRKGTPLLSLGTTLDVTRRINTEEALRNALTEVEKMKNRLQAENIYLQDEIKTEHNFEEIISRGKECKRVLHKVEQVAATDATVLLQGETGTGKELLARAIHDTSKRQDRPLVKINCAAIPANLIESELFGHEKGAFTGALEKKIGRFELADKGTIFLDEIGELPLALQSKLLRVLQEGEFERLGNPRTIKVNVRVIAATNRDLKKALEMGTFRQDLFYRLNVFPINCPPLRERKEDIPLLVNHFIKRFCAKLGKKIESVPLNVMSSLQDYHWPGNVRELENVIERAVILSENSVLRLDDLSDRVNTPLDQVEDLATVKEAERSLILKILEETNWMIGGKRGAAKRLGVAPSTLRDRIKKFGLKRPL